MLEKETTFRSGLLGKTLAHSHSPAIHAMLGNPDYKLFEVAEEDVGAFLQSDFDGINVTIPYKKTVMPYLRYIDTEALEIGSVNLCFSLCYVGWSKLFFQEVSVF